MEPHPNVNSQKLQQHVLSVSCFAVSYWACPYAQGILTTCLHGLMLCVFFCHHKSVASIVLRVCCSFVLLFHSFLFSTLFSHSLSFSLCLFTCTRGRGLAFTSAHLLVRAPIDGPGSQPTDIGDHSVCTPCSRTDFGRVTTACVSSPKRLGSVHWLAHAAGHGHFLGASTSGRSVRSV